MAVENKEILHIQTELDKAQRYTSTLEYLKEKCQIIEKDLREKNEFFHHVLESLSHPFYVLDANDYSILIANSAAHLSDLSTKHTCYALTHHRDAPCEGSEHTCPLQEVKRTKQPFTVEHVHYDIDGNPRNVEVHAFPIFDEDGNVTKMIEYSLDITERKRLEQEIKDYADRIKYFAYTITHDLKNPLIAIHGLTNLMAKQYRDRLDDKGKVYCDQITKESHQALVLIEEINTYIKTKETTLNLLPLNFKEILVQVREEFQTALANRHLQWSEPESIPEIKADRMSLVRVVRNFIDNALKYGGPDLSRIAIGYGESENFHIFSVSDDGVGIALEQKEKIFDVFQRGESSQGKEGTGLGLAIVREIATRHGGKTWSESNPGKGMTFYFSLPKN